jgi:hypothetical protein
MEVLPGQKPNSLVFPDRTELEKLRVEPSSFNRHFSPFVIKHKKIYWGGLPEASLVVAFFFIVMSLSQRRGVKRRRVRGGCPDHATIVKAEAAEASISIPPLHWSLYVKVSNSFLKGLNL